MNIVSLVLEALGPGLVGKLAAAAGIKSAIVQKAIGAALPAVLAAIVTKVGTPGGAKALGDLVAKQDTELLGKLGDLVGSPRQKAVADAGLDALRSLLGSVGLGALTGALGKFAGVDREQSSGLLGMLAPVVLGTLGQQQKADDLDASGLANMLVGQKDHIAAAMPPDFTRMLAGSGLLDALGPAFGKPAAAAVTNAAGKGAASTIDAAAGAAPAPRKGFNWLAWLIALIAASLLWWYVFGTARKPVAMWPPAPNAMVGAVGLGGDGSQPLARAPAWRVAHAALPAGAPTGS